MDDLIKDFLVERNENLGGLDSELVKLETDPSSQELLSSVFRTIHTIKGSGGFPGLSKLEKVAPVGENLLSLLRDALEETSDEALVNQKKKPSEKQAFLLFAGPDDSRMALRLSTVGRLEEFAASNVEKSGGEWMIQYRGKILPLIRLEVVLEERRTRLRHGSKLVQPDLLQVLVCHDEGRTIGIIVERILDIIEDRADVKSPAVREGILCTVVINDRVTELIDVPAIFRISEANRTLSTVHAQVVD